MLFKISKIIKKKFGKNLVSIVLFGSFVRGFKGQDIDILVVVRNLPKSWKKIRCLEKKLESHLFKKTERICDIHLFSPKNFKENLVAGSFLTGLALGYRVIFDSEDTSQEIKRFVASLKGKPIKYVDKYGEWEIGKIAEILHF